MHHNIVLFRKFFHLPAYPYNFASVLGIVIIAVVMAITLITWIKRPDTVKNAGSTTVEETLADAGE